MKQRRSFPWTKPSASAAAVPVLALVVVLVLAGCGSSAGMPSAASVRSVSWPAKTASPAPSGSPAAPASTVPATPPTTVRHVPYSPWSTVASGHHTARSATTTQPPVTTSPVAPPSGPAPAAAGTYRYHQVGSLPGTPAVGILVVAPASPAGTQAWTRLVGGTVPASTSVMRFDGTGAYLVSPGGGVTGSAASCTFAAPVPWPSWPTTVGKNFAAPATCTGGVSTYRVTGHVQGTAALPLDGHRVETAVVVNTFVVKGNVSGTAFSVTLTETDYYAPTLRVPVVTRTHVAGTALGLPITSDRTDTLESATPS